nr:uncharacterized protein LOC133602796 [Nerophis lumbriciformis]
MSTITRFACTATTIFGLVFGTSISQAEDDTRLIRKANKIARSALIVDTHIDVPYRIHESWEDVTDATENGDFDLPRAQAGGLNVPFMSIYIPARYEQDGGGWQLANELIDGMEALVARAPDSFAMAHTTRDVKRHKKRRKISLALGMENGTPIEGKLENVQYFFERGIRYITLAHSKSNHISDSSYDENRQWNGLSDFGKELIVEMNKVGIMVDVSHLSDDAFDDVIAITKTPVIASHSSARHFTPDWERNMGDESIEKLAKNGGVLQINFGSTFLTEQANAWSQARGKARKAFQEAMGLAEDDPKITEWGEQYREQNPYPFANLEQTLDHFDHVVKLVGIDHVGIGSDYDGVGDSLPADLKDVSQYPNLIMGLLQRGYSERDIKKVLGENLMRVWKASEVYAAKH